MLPGEGQTIDSPYNLHRARVAAGTICSPGWPLSWLFWSPLRPTTLFPSIGDGSGTHVFAATLEEHLRNQEQYKP